MNPKTARKLDNFLRENLSPTIHESEKGYLRDAAKKLNAYRISLAEFRNLIARPTWIQRSHGRYQLYEIIAIIYQIVTGQPTDERKVRMAR